MKKSKQRQERVREGQKEERGRRGQEKKRKKKEEESWKNGETKYFKQDGKLSFHRDTCHTVEEQGQIEIDGRLGSVLCFN